MKLSIVRHNTMGVIKGPDSLIHGLWFPDSESANDKSRWTTAAQALINQGAQIAEIDLTAVMLPSFSPVKVEVEPAEGGGFAVLFPTSKLSEDDHLGKCYSFSNVKDLHVAYAFYFSRWPNPIELYNERDAYNYPYVLILLNQNLDRYGEDENVNALVKELRNDYRTSHGDVDKTYLGILRVRADPLPLLTETELGIARQELASRKNS